MVAYKLKRISLKERVIPSLQTLTSNSLKYTYFHKKRKNKNCVRDASLNLILWDKEKGKI